MNGGAVMIGRLALIELAPPALACAMEPFPVSVRARDALHLTSIEFLRANGQTVTLASFDERLLVAARALDVPVYEQEVSVPSVGAGPREPDGSDGRQATMRKCRSNRL